MLLICLLSISLLEGMQDLSKCLDSLLKKKEYLSSDAPPHARSPVKEQGLCTVAVTQEKWTPCLWASMLNGLDHHLGPASSLSLPTRVQVTRQQGTHRKTTRTEDQSLIDLFFVLVFSPPFMSRFLPFSCFFQLPSKPGKPILSSPSSLSTSFSQCHPMSFNRKWGREQETQGHEI